MNNAATPQIVLKWKQEILPKVCALLEEAKSSIGYEAAEGQEIDKRVERLVDILHTRFPEKPPFTAQRVIELTTDPCIHFKKGEMSKFLNAVESCILNVKTFYIFEDSLPHDPNGSGVDVKMERIPWATDDAEVTSLAKDIVRIVENIMGEEEEEEEEEEEAEDEEWVPEVEDEDTSSDEETFSLVKKRRTSNDMDVSPRGDKMDIDENEL